jgi:hypothetical protein
MEETQGTSQGQDTSAPVSSAPSTSAPAPQTSDERTFKQSEVSGLVSRAKHEAVESYRRQQQEQPQYIEQKYGQNPTQPNTPDDRIRQVAAEEAKRHFETVRQEAYQRSQDEMAQRTVQNFRNKVQAGKDKYQDFDKIAPSEETLGSYPNVVQLLGDYVDNSGDILYHLGQDLTKMELIESMAMRSPQAAIKHMQKLSQSLKDNDAASKVRLPNEPLHQMRPSNTGTDSGAMSVRDYRNKYRV